MEPTSKRFVPALGYRSLTALYDPVVALTTRERTFRRRLLRQLNLATGARVLDLGCGTGTLALLIRRQQPDAEVIGLDGDPQMLRQARDKAAAAELHVRFDPGLSFNLPYDDASFDVVVSSLFFHHLTRGDKQRTLTEVRRVLRPAGELHVADWGRPGGPLMRVLFYGVQLLDGFATTADNVAGALPELFREAGFDEVSVEDEISTMLGTLTLYRAREPAA